MLVLTKNQVVIVPRIGINTAFKHELQFYLQLVRFLSNGGNASAAQIQGQRFYWTFLGDCTFGSIKTTPQKVVAGSSNHSIVPVHLLIMC